MVTLWQPWVQLETVHRLGDMTDVQKEAELRHQEVLDLIVSLSDVASLDTASSVSSPFHLSNSMIMLAKDQPSVFRSI